MHMNSNSINNQAIKPKERLCKMAFRLYKNKAKIIDFPKKALRTLFLSLFVELSYKTHSY